MVMLRDEDIQTKEVLSWNGLHLFHHPMSSCSQKTRIFLRLKGISWHSHPINLIKKEQLTPYYMGINPRGLIPSLVHDGKVIIESNDILQYLEAEFPEPSLIPTDSLTQLSALLNEEDDLHLDIRTLTMRFVFPKFMVKRPERDIAVYENSGSGTVNGVQDTRRSSEARFWRNMNTHNGITDAQAARSFFRFKEVIDRYELALAEHSHLAGEDLSVVDIAWYIYARRLLAAGYPVSDLHPRFAAWFGRMHANPNFREEVPSGGLPGLFTTCLRLIHTIKGVTLPEVVRSSQTRMIQ